MNHNPYQSPLYLDSNTTPPRNLPPGQYSFYADPRKLARFVQVMLVISLLMDVVIMISDVAELSLLNRIPFVSEDEALASDMRQLAIGVIGLLVFLVTAIAFLTWVNRMNKNCHHFGAYDMQFTSGWAVGWFFVPVANYFKPYQMMKEMWQVSTDPVNWQVEEGSSVVSLWWAVWIISNIVAMISARMYIQAQTLPTIKASVYLSIGSNVLSMLACVAALVLVSKLTSLQTSLVWGERTAGELD